MLKNRFWQIITVCNKYFMDIEKLKICSSEKYNIVLQNKLTVKIIENNNNGNDGR